MSDTASRSTTRAVRMFAAVREGFEPHHVDSDQSVVAERLTDMLRRMRANGSDEMASGWRIVPVTVSIDARATLFPTDSTEDA